MRSSDWSSDVCSSDLNPKPGSMRLIGVFGTECLSNERVACCVFRPCLGQQPCPGQEYGASCEGDDDVLMSHGAAAGIKNKGIRRRSEERRVGTECARRCNTRWWLDPEKKNKRQ